jgi:hypothetical protein
MSATTPRLPNFVIGGTEKAGTTSVFDWLSRHPQVAASSRKETDFFRGELSGDRQADARRYAAYFEHANPAAQILVEASPGYLGEAAAVAPRMGTLMPEVKLLLILRDPIERIHSSYHFHRARLNLPRELAFDDYVRRCLAYDRGEATPQQLGLDEWYLKVLRFGCYAEGIAAFRTHLRPEYVKVTFFEELRQDERDYMTDLSHFLGIDPGYWHDFEFRPSNVTFSARHTGLHRIAMRTNALAEPLMRRYPAFKQSLVRVYKAFNQEREGYDPMPLATREVLADYYAPSIRALARQLDRPVPVRWLRAEAGRAAA